MRSGRLDGMRLSDQVKRLGHGRFVDVLKPVGQVFEGALRLSLATLATKQVGGNQLAT